MEAEWLDGTVRDQVLVTVTPFPLPYHDHAFEVARLVPYFIDLCDSGGGCHNREYMDLSYKYQPAILRMPTWSANEFVTWWTEKVAVNLKLDVEELRKCYTDEDSHKTDKKTRAMWQYAAARGVNATPTVFVNGVRLPKVPRTVHAWTTLLDNVREGEFGLLG